MSRKRKYGRFLIICIVVSSILFAGAVTNEYEKAAQFWQSAAPTSAGSGIFVYPCGQPVGIYIKAQGVLVLGCDPIEDKNGNLVEPSIHQIEEGDYILAVNGNVLHKKEDLSSILASNKGEEIEVSIKRDDTMLTANLTPVEDKDGNYKLGLWIRGDTQGIGTITYITEDNEFAALGHGINDVDTNTLFQLNGGGIYESKILSIVKGTTGTPGELYGMIRYGETTKLGDLTKNTKAGIFGQLQNSDLAAGELMEAAAREEVKAGDARLLCNIDGTAKYYDVKIEMFNTAGSDSNKEMVVKITDQELLDKTGGIVQGMSGSPIIQNGKFVGAVTHVFVNDPTKGYGIFAETMLEQG